jgi:hypothetical protein
VTETAREARAYAELERSLEPQKARSIARGPIGLIGVLVVMTLLVGIVAAIDLRRRQSPGGAALGWTTSVVFGDCDTYRQLSVPPPDAAAERPQEEVCGDLLRETEDAREEPARYDVELRSLEESRDEATAVVRVTRADVPPFDVELPLRLDGDQWKVVRTFELCLEIGCP